MIINTFQAFPLFPAETQGCSLSSLLLRPTVRKETGSPLPVWDPHFLSGIPTPTACFFHFLLPPFPPELEPFINSAAAWMESSAQN